MAITTAMCNSFKQELMEGTHDLNTDVLKVALYTSSATLGATTTAYSATNEISGTGYSAGGANLTVAGGTPALDTGVAYLDFDDTSWTTATFTAAGALIYNSSKSNKAICALDFGGNQTVSAGTFQLQWPAPAAATAIIRIA